MKTITHIITGLNVGGAERALHTLLTGGLQGPFDNRVVSLMDEGHYGPLLRDAGIPVTCLGMSPGRPGPVAIMRLRRIMRDAPSDIVQGWMYHGNLAASLAGRLAPRRPKVVWNIRRSLESLSDLPMRSRVVMKVGSLFSGSPDGIFYNAARSRQQHEAAGYDKTSSHVIPNGFDTTFWRPVSGAHDGLRQELGFDPKSTIVGFIGRNNPDKDLPNLLRAFDRIRGTFPQVRLVCVGTDLKLAAANAPVSDAVVFVGHKTDIPAIVSGFDVLCLSSRVEGFPNVIGEAMACGVPCVTTDVGDAAMIVGETGWVAPAQDSEALAQRLREALCASADERYHRGQAARHRIETQFSLAAALDQYLAFYTKLAGVR